MKTDRKVVARKRQQLLPIPPEVRDHLGLIGGTRVWWHIGRVGQVAITLTGRVKAGRPREDEDCPACSKYRDELQRYKREVRDGDAATPGEFWRAGYARALGDVGNVKADIELVLDLVKEIAGRPRRAPARRPPARRSPAPRPTEVVDAPVLAEPLADEGVQLDLETAHSNGGPP